MAKLLDKMDDPRDWVTNGRRHRGDRDGGNDSGSDNDGRDRHPITCRTGGNSFPTGTEVLMADGSHRPINLIEPGDRVMAADVATGVWSARTVVDQRSHLDRGSMATATLADDSQMTATDHHLFWVASDGTWRELEDVGPGDHLLTPDGVTTVDAVEVTGLRSTLGWELDVAVDDTFTVSSGTADVLVHNAGPCSPGDLVQSRLVIVGLLPEQPEPFGSPIRRVELAALTTVDGRSQFGDAAYTGLACEGRDRLRVWEYRDGVRLGEAAGARRGDPEMQWFDSRALDDEGMAPHANSLDGAPFTGYVISGRAGVIDCIVQSIEGKTVDLYRFHPDGTVRGRERRSADPMRGDWSDRAEWFDNGAPRWAESGLSTRHGDKPWAAI